MMSLEDIRSESVRHAKIAARKNLTPLVPWDAEEIAAWGESQPFPFPVLGDYVPPGWRLVEEYFVDSSGFGMPHEPALVASVLREKILQHINDLVPSGYGIREVGQFQCYVGRFVRNAAAARPQRRSRRRPALKVVG